jgi:hypothetical protein
LQAAKTETPWTLNPESEILQDFINGEIHSIISNQWRWIYESSKSEHFLFSSHLAEIWDPTTFNQEFFETFEPNVWFGNKYLELAKQPVERDQFPITYGNLDQFCWFDFENT